MQGGCGQLDVDVGHDEAGHLERCACCGTPLLQHYGEAPECSFDDQVYGIDFCAELRIGFDCVQ